MKAETINIKFNGKSEIWYISPDEDLAVFSFARANDIIEASKMTMPTSDELFEVDQATGKSRVQLMKQAGVKNAWWWVADKTAPAKAAFITTDDEQKRECSARFVRALICR